MLVGICWLAFLSLVNAASPFNSEIVAGAALGSVWTLLVLLGVILQAKYKVLYPGLIVIPKE